MARAFDELESMDPNRRRRLASGHLQDLQEMLMRGAPPPSRSGWIEPQDPSVDTFNQRWRGEGAPLPKGKSYPVKPGTRERFLDPTKAITEGGKMPPSLNAPMKRAPTEGAMLPPGFVFDDERGT